jgi:hypothetical protein
MIFIVFHYGHWGGGGGDNPDSSQIQIAPVLAHHHALSLSHLQFLRTIVAPARRRTTNFGQMIPLEFYQSKLL